jgi:regulator of CtrA degradation
MQLASWLLLRRAVANGELTVADAYNHKRRVRLLPQSTAQAEGFADLPEKFKSLIAASNRLYDRVLRLDELLSDGVAGQPPEASPVDNQIERIRLAFPAA